MSGTKRRHTLPVALTTLSSRSDRTSGMASADRNESTDKHHQGDSVYHYLLKHPRLHPRTRYHQRSAEPRPTCRAEVGRPPSRNPESTVHGTDTVARASPQQRTLVKKGLCQGTGSGRGGKKSRTCSQPRSRTTVPSCRGRRNPAGTVGGCDCCGERDALFAVTGCGANVSVETGEACHSCCRRSSSGRLARHTRRIIFPSLQYIQPAKHGTQNDGSRRAGHWIDTFDVGVFVADVLISACIEGVRHGSTYCHPSRQGVGSRGLTQ